MLCVFDSLIELNLCALGHLRNDILGKRTDDVHVRLCFTLNPLAVDEVFVYFAEVSLVLFY